MAYFESLSGLVCRTYQ